MATTLVTPSTNSINTTSGNDLGADGITWAQGNPIIVDKFGKLLIWPERYNSNATRLRPVVSSDGITWTEPTISGFFDAAGDLGTRMSLAYDSVNDIIHGLLVDDTATDGIIYRRYTITRDGSNNISTVTRDATVNLQLDFQVSTNVMVYGFPTLFWYGDAAYGTYGALLALWGAQNTLAGSVGSEVRASMVVLGSTATQGATAANWKAPVSASTTTIGNAPAVAYSAIATSTTANVGSLTTTRKTGGVNVHDLYLFYSLDVAGVFKWQYRRAQWNSTSNDWSTGLTAEQTISLQTVAGTDSGYSLKFQLISKSVEDTTNDKVWVGFPVWLSNASGDTWSVASVDSADTVSALVNAYSAGGAHSYAPTGDVMFDSTSGLLVVSYDVTGASANYGHLATYLNGVASQADTALTDTTLCDIPVLLNQRVGDSLLCLYRDTVNTPTPPYHGHTTLMVFQASSGKISLTVPRQGVSDGPTRVAYRAYAGDGNLRVGATPTYGVIQTAAAGFTAIAPAPGAGKSIYVTSYTLETTGTVGISFTSPRNNYLTGSMAMNANQNAFMTSANGYPVLRGTAAATLYIGLSASVNVGGHFTYFVAPA